MPPFVDDGDDDDKALRDLPDGSSENELDYPMQDAEDGEAEADGEVDDGVDGDGGAEGEGDGEADGDGDGDGDEEEDDDAAAVDSPSNSSQGSANESASAPTKPNIHRTSPTPAASPAKTSSNISIRPKPRPETVTATSYDIVPTIAAPQSTSINSITSTADMRWVFTGGSDGYIRRYNWVDTVNGKLMLTVAQRHPFVDTVVKAGVIMTYWENWDHNARAGSPYGPDNGIVSPVYSLAAQHQGLWLLSGLESGGIRLQSVRHEEGKEIALLQKHTSAVSVLSLASDEKSVLSGSWDKSVHDWDLNVGKVRASFASSVGQVSAIEPRPISSVGISGMAEEQPPATDVNGSFSSNNHVSSGTPRHLVDETKIAGQDGPTETKPHSPDSLFGGDEVDDDDDLFGDSGGPVTINGTELTDAFGEEVDEFSRAIADGPRPEDANIGTPEPSNSVARDAESSSTQKHEENGTPPLPNGVSAEPNLVTAEEIVQSSDGGPGQDAIVASQDESGNRAAGESSTASSDSVFMVATIDGNLRIWDKRQPNPIARISPRNTPPWCTSSCWSPDGNYIYAGRRNGTIDEYSLHHGLHAPSRVLRFPQGSGAVTAVKAMPNSRHLICASHDILRLYDVTKESDHANSNRSSVPFLIVPGHRTGVISQLHIDPECRYMISTGGNRGWEGASTEVLLGYEIGVVA